MGSTETTKISLSNGSSLTIIGNITSEKSRNYGNTNTISFFVTGFSEEYVRATFTNPDALTCIVEYGKDGVTPLAQFYNYTRAMAISQSYYHGFVNGYPVMLVTLMENTNIEEMVTKLTEQVTGLSNENAKLRNSLEQSPSSTLYQVDITNLRGEALQDEIIKQSKEKLSDYLSTATIESSIHTVANQKAIYSISEASQIRLNRVIQLTQDAIASNNTSFKPYWHESGKPNKYDWTLSELQALSLEIDLAVSKLVKKQQDIESTVLSTDDYDTLIALYNNIEYSI